MKTPLIVLTFFALVGTSFAAPPLSVKGRTIGEIKVIPEKVLKRSISPKFYKTLTVSPIEGLITVRAQLSGTNVFGERVVRSDLEGAFDKVALQVVKDIKMTGAFTLDSQNKTSTILMHLLIYKIADGTLALYFATLDGGGSDQQDYFGSAKLAVLKDNGRWAEIKGPAGLDGKGMAVKQSLRNSFSAQMKLERFDYGR